MRNTLVCGFFLAASAASRTVFQNTLAAGPSKVVARLRSSDGGWNHSSPIILSLLHLCTRDKVGISGQFPIADSHLANNSTYSRSASSFYRCQFRRCQTGFIHSRGGFVTLSVSEHRTHLISDWARRPESDQLSTDLSVSRNFHKKKTRTHIHRAEDYIACVLRLAKEPKPILVWWRHVQCRLACQWDTGRL